MWTPATTSLACRHYRRIAGGLRRTTRHPLGICLPVWVVLLSACLLATGCGRTINRAAERRIRDALPQYIGPAHVWRAHVENPPERTIRGKLSQISIDGEGVDFGEIIRLEQLHLDMRDATFDVGARRLTSVASTSFQAAINERDLNEYLRKFPPPNEEPVRIKRVWLRPGHLYAEGTRWALGKAWPFTATSEPSLVSKTRVKFDVDKMSVVGLTVPLPSSWLRWLSHRLSQGFDFTTLPFPLQLDTFKVDSGRLTVSGTADVMESLNRRIACLFTCSASARIPTTATDIWEEPLPSWRGEGTESSLFR